MQLIPNLNMHRYYYYVKPFLPRRLQILLRRWVAVRKLRLHSHCWPIDNETRKLPHEWKGWPDGKRFALVLTHDVDTQRGHDRCLQLMEMELASGFRSSFNFTVEDYEVSPRMRHCLVANGFEVGIHGLHHNGLLYKSKKEFNRQSVWINHYLKEWAVSGFRSPCMYHNLEWMHELNISYDSSTFDTDPFEPQSDGVKTIFPFYVAGNHGQRGYVELPYTMPQDFTLFVLFQEQGIETWKRKLDWVAANGGLALLITHPDYMHFGNGKRGLEEYPARWYKDLLDYVKERYCSEYWPVLPRQMAEFWMERSPASAGPEGESGRQSAGPGPKACAELYPETMGSL